MTFSGIVISTVLLFLTCSITFLKLEKVGFSLLFSSVTLITKNVVFGLFGDNSVHKMALGLCSPLGVAHNFHMLRSSVTEGEARLAGG